MEEDHQEEGLLMEELLGLLRVRVIRGINLAIRDVRSSDPYVILRLTNQKVKTRVIKKNINPEWNEDLTLYVIDPTIPVKLQVYDKDLTWDDKMGDAEFDISPYFEALKKTYHIHNHNRHNIISSNNRSRTTSSLKILETLKPSRQNCLSEESCIISDENGNVTQHMFLRLRNVERGEIEINLDWIHIPDSRSFLNHYFLPKKSLRTQSIR